MWSSMFTSALLTPAGPPTVCQAQLTAIHIDLTRQMVSCVDDRISLLKLTHYTQLEVLLLSVFVDLDTPLHLMFVQTFVTKLAEMFLFLSLL